MNIVKNILNNIDIEEYFTLGDFYILIKEGKHPAYFGKYNAKKSFSTIYNDSFPIVSINDINEFTINEGRDEFQYETSERRFRCQYYFNKSNQQILICKPVYEDCIMKKNKGKRGFISVKETHELLPIDNYSIYVTDISDKLVHCSLYDNGYFEYKTDDGFSHLFNDTINISKGIVAKDISLYSDNTWEWQDIKGIWHVGNGKI